MAIQKVTDAFVAVQTAGDTYEGNAANQTYSLNPNLIGAGDQITLIDQGGTNKIELVGGLQITSSVVISNEAVLTLSNGAIINIRNADTFTYVDGGNTAGGIAGQELTFSEFVTAIGSSIPATGAPATTTTTPVTVTSGGGTSSGGSSTGGSSEFSIAAAIPSVAEGASGTVTNIDTTITRTGDTTDVATVDVAIAGVTATVGTDFTALATQTVNFAAGETSKTVSVAVTGDGDIETDETLTATLNSASTGSTISSTAGNVTLTIANDDVAGQVIRLTNSIDFKDGATGDDVFDGLINEQGTATLNSSDRLNGGDGDDTLVGEFVAAQTVAPQTSNIETLELITRAATTFDTINTDNVTAITAKNGSAALTVSNIDSLDINATIKDQSSNLTLQYTNALLAGSNALSINLDGAQAGATNGPVLTVTQQAGTDTSGIETLTLNSIGTNQNFLNSVIVQNSAATVASTVSTLNVSGTQALAVNTAVAASVTTVDASSLAGGGLSATFANADSSSISVKGGSGADSITFGANAGNITADMGTGNDFFSLANFDTSDTIDGGDGTDTLAMTAANAEAVTATLSNISSFEALTLTTSATATTDATYFGDINTVTLQGTANTGATLTMAAGSKTVNIGNAAANAALTGALTINDTGTASDDTLVIANTNSGGATNVFAAQNLTIQGYETTTINTGSSATAAQTFAAVVITGDSTSGDNTLNFTGANSVTLTAPATSNSSGLFTVDASGLTGNAVFSNVGQALGFAGTLGSIKMVGTNAAVAATGAFDDNLIGHASVVNDISGGAGHDNISGGTQADTLDGGAGNDTIVTAGGNDTVTAGAGNDTITNTVAGNVNIDAGSGNDTVAMDSTITKDDVIAGGDGTDTLSYSTALLTATSAVGISGFEVLQLDTGGLGNQDLSIFTNNTGFTTVAANNNAATAFATVADTVTTLSLLGTGGAATATLDRLIDGSGNTLTITGDDSTSNVDDGATAYATVTVDDEETLTLVSGSNANENLTITTLNADDVTSLTATGTGDVIITNQIVGADALATVSANGVTGAVTINGSVSTVAMTMTGSLIGVNTLSSGTGNDIVTAGTANDVISTAAGNDTITASGGNDIITAGDGADIVDAGIGNDTITGGEDGDTLTGGAGNDTFIFSATNNGTDTITDFVTGTDDLNITSNQVMGAAVVNDQTAAAGGQAALVDNSNTFISTNGTAANLTTGGTASVSTADMTATTLTNLAAYLSERFTTVADDEAVLVVNWTVSGSSKTYIYDYNESTTTANTTIDANEIALIGIVERGSDATDVLVAGDLV